MAGARYLYLALYTEEAALSVQSLFGTSIYYDVLLAFVLFFGNCACISLYMREWFDVEYDVTW